MFGTDMDLLSPSLMVGLVDSAGLDPTAYAAVLHGNARRVFKLGPAMPSEVVATGSNPVGGEPAAVHGSTEPALSLPKGSYHERQLSTSLRACP